MTKFFKKPVMDDLTTKELCGDVSGATSRVTTKFRREMFAYKVRMLVFGVFAWGVIYVFWVGVMTVSGASK